MYLDCAQRNRDKAFQGASHSSLHINNVRHHQNKMEWLIKRWRQLFHQSRELCSWGTHCSKEDLHSSYWSESRNRRSWACIFCLSIWEDVFSLMRQTCNDLHIPAPSKLNPSESSESSVSTCSPAKESHFSTSFNISSPCVRTQIWVPFPSIPKSNPECSSTQVLKHGPLQYTNWEISVQQNRPFTVTAEQILETKVWWTPDCCLLAPVKIS